jgi:hypothetical protein
MILSNFTPLGSVGKGLNEIYLAEVAVTTGRFLWRKTETRKVFRGVGEYWKFVDTGEYPPTLQCEFLEHAHLGQQAFAQLQSNNPTTTTP